MNYATLTSLLLLWPTLYSMQDPEQISLNLIRAASNCNASAYHQAADETIAFARQHPHNYMQHLGTGIAFSTPNPDIVGHTLAIGYDLVFNSRIQVAFSLVRALTSVITFWPTPLSPLEYTRLPRGYDLVSRTSIISHEIGLIRHLWNQSWSSTPRDIASIAINALPSIREELLIRERNRLLVALNEIQNQPLQPLVVGLDQQDNAAPAA